MTTHDGISEEGDQITVTEHELAVHLFADADGPQADAAWQEVRAIWSRCRPAGLTEPVARLGLPANLPNAPPRGHAPFGHRKSGFKAGVGTR